jgi:phospholipase C
LAADLWLSQNIPPILDYVNAHDGLLIITLDEGLPGSDNSGCCAGGPGGVAPGFGGRVGLLALGPRTRAGSVTHNQYDHMSLLRTLEDVFGIGTYLNNAAQSRAMADLFAAPAGAAPAPAPTSTPTLPNTSAGR